MTTLDLYKDKVYWKPQMDIIKEEEEVEEILGEINNFKPTHVIKAERKRAEYEEAYVERELTQE
jgi:hypothetical protein